MDTVIFNTVVSLEEETSLFSADQFGGYASTAVFAIINVIVAYIVIKLLIFKPIMNIMKKREDQIRASVEDADKAKEDAVKNAEQSKQAIDDARIEAADILEQSKENAEKQADVIIAKANDDAAEIIARAETDAKRIKRVALEEMKDELSDLAVKISAKVLGDVISEDKLKDLSDKYTDETLTEEVNKLE